MAATSRALQLVVLASRSLMVLICASQFSATLCQQRLIVPGNLDDFRAPARPSHIGLNPGDFGSASLPRLNKGPEPRERTMRLRHAAIALTCPLGLAGATSALA